MDLLERRGRLGRADLQEALVALGRVAAAGRQASRAAAGPPAQRGPVELVERMAPAGLPGYLEAVGHLVSLVRLVLQVRRERVDRRVRLVHPGLVEPAALRELLERLALPERVDHPAAVEAVEVQESLEVVEHRERQALVALPALVAPAAV